jgi:hypothetical protein
VSSVTLIFRIGNSPLTNVVVVGDVLYTRNAGVTSAPNEIAIAAVVEKLIVATIE